LLTATISFGADITSTGAEALNPNAALGTGVMVNPPKGSGYVGRAVVDTDGVPIGHVAGIGGKTQNGAPQIFVKTADGAKTVALNPGDIAPNATGDLVTARISRSQIMTQPATTATAAEQAGPVGKTVFSSDGKPLGKVDNVMLDPTSGEFSAFLVITGMTDAPPVSINRAMIVADAAGRLSTPHMTAAQFESITGKANTMPGKAVTQ
jgi:sporulation protein YlmC with PRC-barrel domain